MSTTREGAIADICEANGADLSRVLDIVLAVQKKFGCVDSSAIDQIAETVSVPRVEVESVVSFYSFLSTEQKGHVTIRLCNDIIDEMKGSAAVAEGLEEELGIRFGETTSDGKFTLEYTSCIGMSDQAPAALVNDLVIPRLGPRIGPSGCEHPQGAGQSRQHREPSGQVVWRWEQLARPGARRGA